MSLSSPSSLSLSLLFVLCCLLTLLHSLTHSLQYSLTHSRLAAHPHSHSLFPPLTIFTIIVIISSTELSLYTPSPTHSLNYSLTHSKLAAHIHSHSPHLPPPTTHSPPPTGPGVATVDGVHSLLCGAFQLRPKPYHLLWLQRQLQTRVDGTPLLQALP